MAHGTDHCCYQPKRWGWQNGHGREFGVGVSADEHSCLVVDSDPQGSLTISLGFDPDELGGHRLYEGMVLPPERPQHQDLEPLLINLLGLSVVPANLDLAAAELDLNAQSQREFALRRGVKAHSSELRMDPDVVLPP